MTSGVSGDCSNTVPLPDDTGAIATSASSTYGSSDARTAGCQTCYIFPMRFERPPELDRRCILPSIRPHREARAGKQWVWRHHHVPVVVPLQREQRLPHLVSGAWAA